MKVLTPEDFIVFKALSTRDRDIDDAASALRRSGDIIDTGWIEEEIRALATEIPDFDASGRLVAICERAKAPPDPRS